MLSLITVSDTFQHFQVPIAEYIHRLSRDISIVHIPPEKSTDMRVIIKKETEKIIQVLKKKYGKKKGYVVLCDETGVHTDTRKFATDIAHHEMTHSHVVYIVGGAYGVDIDMLSPYIQSVQSLGAWVMPHGLAVLVLLEQIYRARQIAKNTGYHHEKDM